MESRFLDNLNFIFSWSPERGPGEGDVANLGGEADAAELLHVWVLAPGHPHLVERGQAAGPDRPGGECQLLKQCVFS